MPSPLLSFPSLSGWVVATWDCVSAWAHGMLCSPGILACPWGSKATGRGVSISNGNEIPSPSVPPGAALLDLEQTTLPGIAHLVVETMIVSDQIRPEDRASVLRTLLLKHRCQGGVPGRGDGLQVQLPSRSTDSLKRLFPVCLNTSSDRELIPSPFRKYQPLESS